MSTTIFVIVSIKSSILGTSVKLCISLHCGDTDQPPDFAMVVINELPQSRCASRYPLNADIIIPQSRTLTFNFRLHNSFVRYQFKMNYFND